MTQTIEQLTARVRELEEELDAAYKAVDDNWVSHQQLVASQAYAEQLREAIEQITKQMFTSYKAKNGRDCYIEDDSGELCYIVPHEPIITAQHAIDIPHDTSALDAYVAEKVKEAMK